MDDHIEEGDNGVFESAEAMPEFMLSPLESLPTEVSKSHYDRTRYADLLRSFYKILRLAQRPTSTWPLCF